MTPKIANRAQHLIDVVHQGAPDWVTEPIGFDMIEALGGDPARYCLLEPNVRPLYLAALVLRASP